MRTQLRLHFCTSYKVATEAWSKIIASVFKIWSTCPVWQKLHSTQYPNSVDVWKAQSLAFQSLMHSKTLQSEPFCSYLNADIVNFFPSAFMPLPNVCNNFCFKSKYSSIAIIISSHRALILHKLMEIQIPVSNSVISWHFFYHAIIYP